jgi:Skp family chaperone for outer membrane proteins
LFDRFRDSTLWKNDHLKNYQKCLNVGIGVLDGQKLKRGASCFRGHDKLADILSEVLSKVRMAESRTKEEYEKIKLNPNLSQKQKLKGIAKIEAKWSDVSAKYNSEIQSIRNADLRLSEHIQSKLGDIIKSIAKSLKLQIVFSKGTSDDLLVFYSAKGLDITDLIIQKMNEILPDIALKELTKHD